MLVQKVKTLFTYYDLDYIKSPDLNFLFPESTHRRDSIKNAVAQGFFDKIGNIWLTEHKDGVQKMTIDNKPVPTEGENRDAVSVYIRDPGPPKMRFLLLEPILLARIVNLGWPVILGMLTQTAINTIDLLMVGRLDDSEAVPGTAAIMASVVLLWAYGGFLSSISVGTQAISARRYSEGALTKAGQALANSVAVSLVASVVITLLAISLIEPTMLLLTKSPEVQVIGSNYSRIRLLSLPSMALMASFKSFYDGIGRVRIHMTIAIIMNLINIIVNYFLIYGYQSHGITITALGVYGAAWGSVVSSYAGIIIMIWWALRKGDRSRFLAFRWSNLNKKIALTIARLSVWSGLATVVLMVGVGLFNYIVSVIDADRHTGSINASAASIIIHVMMLVFMTCLAFGTSTATLVSQSIGAQNTRLAERYVWQCVLLAVYVMTAFGVLTYFFPRPILTLFLPPDFKGNELKELVISTAIPSLKLVAIFLSPTAAAGLVLTQALYGAGETRFIMLVEFFLHFFCLVPLAWFLAIHLDMGVYGCFIAAIIYAGGLMIATAARFIQGGWKKLRL